MIRVALIGIGGMGFVHYNAYKKVNDAEIVAVADPRVEMAKEKIGADNVNVYSHIDELLANEKVDMVDICTPSYTHADLAIKAMEAGLDVLCEKPMSVTTSEAERMLEVKKRTGKRLMIAHVVRFMAPYVYLKSVIESGELGKPLSVQMRRISSIPRWSWEDWMRNVSKSGGAPIDLSIHDIDFAQYVFGKPREILSMHKPLACDTNYIVSNLVYDGFSVNIVGGWFCCAMSFDASYVAVFEKGVVKSEYGKVIKCGEEVQLEVGVTSENTGINLTGADGYADEIAYFVDCIKKGIDPDRVTPESSLYSVSLTSELVEKAATI
ncbi:MAG: Gfo/Idh/MocA family oxidoreductase [Clostridia bacterium]|nr:Gfo/Idh/MocA family oxidoreductase [Clostridia bacterium]